MERIELYQIDAFTNKLFHGNPAVICLLSEWLNDELLQAIARENNLSETAFVIPQDNGHHIRWFTPKTEINLCGHATLAAAFLLFELSENKTDVLHFSSLGGVLTVRRKKGRLVMDFPKLPVFSSKNRAAYANLIDKPVLEVYESDLDYLLLLSDEDDVFTAQIDLKALSKLPKRGLILTTQGEDVDFYSRCFYPKYDILEDPVTGSAHCILAPFWAERLQKNSLIAEQGSSRKGQVYSEVSSDLVHISGHCRWYSKGELML